MNTTELSQVLRAEGGVVRRRDHPQLGGSIDWLVRTGQLVAVLPGVYAPAEVASLPALRMRAVGRAHPDAVLVGAAAARCTFWPAAPLEVVEAASRRKLRAYEGFRFPRRVVPPELVVESDGLRFTTPALTAIDLAILEESEAVDVALRSRQATLAGMYDALRATPYRAGNADRLKLLLDSRDEPWSEAERRGHRLLRSAGIGGWRANLPVTLAGRCYYLDIAFRRQRLAIEIDGRIHECDRELFESDRWRQNALVQAGWRVLRFTWSMLVNHPDVVVEAVRAALKNDLETAVSAPIRPLRAVSR